MVLETTAVTTLKLISAGFCLGIGFWASKKLTNLVDEKLLIYDKRKIKQLEQEMNISPQGA